MKSTVAGLAHRLLSLAVPVAVVLVISSGCRKGTPTPQDTNTPTQTQSQTQTPTTDTTQPKEDKVIATVNGTPITESQVQRRIDDEYKPALAKYAAQSPELAAQFEKGLREDVLQYLVIEQLLNEEAKKANMMEVTDEELTAVITKQLSAMDPPLTMEAYRRMIESKGGNFAVLKAAHARELKYHKLFEAKVTGSLTTTEEDARKYYDGNPEDFRVPERVRASHILISTEPTDPNADPNQAKIQARQKAEELLKKVKDGEDFAALAKENSACPSKTQGGDLGMFGRGQMVPPFEEAAFALKAGEVSSLVETQFGYHIIKVTEHQDPNQVPFEKIKDRIIDQLTQQKRKEAIRTYLQSLQQNAKISYSSSSAPATPQATQPVIKPQAPADVNNKK